jgi:hypothetical protein
MKPSLSLIPYPFSSFSYDLEDRKHDPFLYLNWSINTIESKQFIEGVTSLLECNGFDVEDSAKSKEKVAGAYLGGLLSHALDGASWMRRPLGAGDFTGGHIGFRGFIRFHKALVESGLIEVRKGYNSRDGNGGDSIVTRVKPAPPLLALAAEYGITPLNARQHFARVKMPIAVRDPVRVREAANGDWWNAEKGKLLLVDPTIPKAADSIARIQRLNAWFDGVDIDGCEFGGFYRLFNLGDQDGFDFDKGGRLYANGDYQRIKKDKRRAIRINDEAVVEVDVSGSHLTIYHTALGAPLMLSFDPYDVAGIPREVVKSFVVMTLGNGKFQKQWSRPIAKEYAERHGVKLQDAFPLASTREAILERLPALRLLPDSGITWADLQYRESLGLIATVERLAYEFGVPALPLHDAVIVSVGYAALVEKVMKECFWKEAGVMIGVKVKGAEQLTCEDTMLASFLTERNRVPNVNKM